MHFISIVDLQIDTQGEGEKFIISNAVFIGVSVGIIWYVITVSSNAIHFYWFLPLIRPGIVNVLQCHMSAV